MDRTARSPASRTAIGAAILISVLTVLGASNAILAGPAVALVAAAR